MNILLICPYFPPENTVAAVRIGKFAQHLAEAGDSVRVIARRPAKRGLAEVDGGELDVEVERVVDPLLGVASALRKRNLLSSTKTTSPQRGRTSGNRAARALASRAERLVWSVLLVPDQFVFWALRAVRRADLGSWKPDVIVASGGPTSAFVVGRSLSRRYGVPWVADYRDLLSSGPYYRRGRLRRFVDQLLERRVVATSSAVTTVSQPLADNLTRFTGRSCSVVMNGFDPDDFVGLENDGAPGNELVLSHCGYIYPEKRDPTPLFRALEALRREGVGVKVRFYGENGSVEQIAHDEGVTELVEFFDRVSYAESLRVQAGSDVLLLLMWNDPGEVGTYTGKLFEYVGAGRPILMIGYEHGVAAGLIRERSLGVVANDPEEIAEALRAWSKQKADQGRIPAHPLSTQSGLSRQEHAVELRRVITDVVGEDR